MQENQAIIKTSQIEELIEELQFINTDVIAELKEQREVSNELKTARQAVEAVSTDTNALAQIYELVQSAEEKLSSLNELKQEIAQFKSVADENLSQNLTSFKLDLGSRQNIFRNELKTLLRDEFAETMTAIKAERETLEETRKKMSTTNQVMCDNIKNLEKLNKDFQKKNNLYLMKYLLAAFFSSLIIIFAYFTITTKVEQNAKFGFNSVKSAVTKQMKKDFQ